VLFWRARNHATPDIGINPRRAAFRVSSAGVSAHSLRLFRRIAPSGSGVGVAEVKKRVRTTKPRPSQRKIRLKLHRPLLNTDGFSQRIVRVVTTSFIR